MLKYLRPRRGIRMIWIDALCINQKNAAERGSQVAKMSQIYSQCSQVVLWLGSDLVLQDPGNYPRRYRLSGLGDSVPAHFHNQEDRYVSPQRKLNLAKLLERRYFSRIWVIQELILAPRILIPIRDLNFWADGTTMVNRQGSVARSWMGTKAPWFQHLAKGALRTSDFFELIALASKSRATDDRDKLFGVLGLYTDKREEIIPRPDYSLSCQHVFIGFFAHCIINEHRYQLLSVAAGIKESHSGLSWVPEWKSQSSWEQIFQIPDKEYEDAEGFAEAAHSLVYTTSHYNHRLAWNGDRFDGAGDIKRLLYLTHEVPEKREAKIPYRHSVFKTHFWFRDAFIDTDTGAMSLNLTRLLSIQTIPSAVGLIRCSPSLPPGSYLYAFEPKAITKAVNSYVFIASTFKLDELVEPNDEIFILNPETSPLVYLILRPTADSRHSRLVAYCPFLLFQAHNPIDPTFSPIISKMGIVYIQRDLAEDLLLISKALNQSLQSNIFLRYIYPGSLGKELLWDSKLWSLLPLFLAFARERDQMLKRKVTPPQYVDQPYGADYPMTIKLYFGMIPQQFRPQIVDDFVNFTFPGDEWKTSMINDGKDFSSFSGVVWERHKAGSTWTKLDTMAEHDMLTEFSWKNRKEKEFTIRCTFEEIYKQLESLAPTPLLELYGSGLLGVSDGEVEARLSAGPVNEDYFTPSPVRHIALQEFVTRYGVDGRTYQVHIL